MKMKRLQISRDHNSCQICNSNSIVNNIMMQRMITIFSSEVYKEDNQTCTEASSQLAPDHTSQPESPGQNLQEEEAKRQETKLKYRKLKQKLSSIGFQHDDKCVVVKDFTSTKKQRIMKLALDLEKQIKIQNRDYEAMEFITRDILKIVEAKRELDLQLLRQSRFVPALFELLLKIPSLHKAELGQAFRSLELCARTLCIFSSVSVNREYLILTNRLNGLISFGSWILGRQEKKPQNHFNSILYYTFKTINSLLTHKSKEQDANNIISTTIQLIICSPTFKKIKHVLSELFLEGDTIGEAEKPVQLLRFTLLVLRSAMPKLEPQYIHFNDSKEGVGNQMHLFKLAEFLLQFSFSFFVQLKETEAQLGSQLVPQSYPTVIESAMLLTIKIANACFETSLAWLRKFMAELKNDNLIISFLNACVTIVRYCKHEMQEHNDSSQPKTLLNEIMILLAYLGLEAGFQKKIFEIGLLEEIFNLPVQYIMDSYLREVYIPTFCCLINDNKTNLTLFLRDNSPQPIIKMLKKEIASHSSMNKKASTTSLMSMNHISHQYSSVTYESNRLALELRFPQHYWETLCLQLERHL